MFSWARFQKGLSPLFSKSFLFQKLNQKGLTHIVWLRHQRIYVKNRRKHVVLNIEKGLSPDNFYEINQNGLSPIFVLDDIFNIYYLKWGFFIKNAEEYITLHCLTLPTV